MATYKNGFRFWCQTTLPLIYDESLSYYELLCKVVNYINNMIKDINSVDERMVQLEKYVNEYFDNLDYETVINNKLDEMADSGELQAIINGFMGVISATAYGFKGDNKTDNSDVMDKYLKNDIKTPIYFATGNYIFTRPILFMDYMYIICSPEAHFIYKGDTTTEYFIATDVTSDMVRTGCYWQNGVIDANGRANTAMQISGAKYAEIYPRMILNGLRSVISTASLGNYRSSGCNFHNIVLWCPNSGGYNVIGIDDQTYDHFFHHIVIRDISTGIITASSHFEMVDHWTKTESVLLSSVFAIIKGRNNSFVGCVCDTLKTCFKFQGSWAMLNVTDLTIIYNRDFYTTSLMESNPPVIFNNSDYANCLIHATSVHGVYYANTYLVTSRGVKNCYIDGIGMHNETGKSKLFNADLFRQHSLHDRYDGSSDFNAIIDAGEYYVNTDNGTGGVGVPVKVYGVLTVYRYGENQLFQKCINFGVSKLATRYSNDNGATWSEWKYNQVVENSANT